MSLPESFLVAVGHNSMEIGVKCHEDVRGCDEEEGDGGIETKLLREGL